MKRKSFTTIAASAALLACLLIVWGVTSVQAQPAGRQLQQTPTQSSPASQRRLALVIGNGAYTNAPPLKNPPNDGRDVAATLKDLGFDVTSGINVTQRDMKRLIREFGQKLKAGGSGLFYYAGHGVQSRGRNYLIPIDADIQSEAEVEDAGVDVSLVLNYMDDAQNGLNIVILDACRNNPFSRSFRSASDGLAQVDAPTGTLIAYATAPGRVASDGLGQNGLYTSELLKQMRVPGLSVTDMFMRVRAEVMKQTGNKQVPWESSSLVGTFYFGGAVTYTARNETATTTTLENSAASKVDPAAIELAYWETIKNSADRQDFKSYLQKYPNGNFAELAKNRINALTDPLCVDFSTAIQQIKEASDAAGDLIETSEPGKNIRRLGFAGKTDDIRTGRAGSEPITMAMLTLAEYQSKAAASAGFADFKTKFKACKPSDWLEKEDGDDRYKTWQPSWGQVDLIQTVYNSVYVDFVHKRKRKDLTEVPLNCANVNRVFDALKDSSIRGTLMYEGAWHSKLGFEGEAGPMISTNNSSEGSQEGASFSLLITNSDAAALKKYADLKQQLKGCMTGWHYGESDSETKTYFLMEREDMKGRSITITKYSPDPGVYIVSLSLQIRTVTQ